MPSEEAREWRNSPALPSTPCACSPGSARSETQATASFPNPRSNEGITIAEELVRVIYVGCDVTLELQLLLGDQLVNLGTLRLQLSFTIQHQNYLLTILVFRLCGLLVLLKGMEIVGHKAKTGAVLAALLDALTDGRQHLTTHLQLREDRFLDARSLFHHRTRPMTTICFSSVFEHT